MNCLKKLGIPEAGKWDKTIGDAWQKLEDILTKDKLDFIHFFRALSNLAMEENWAKLTSGTEEEKKALVEKLFAIALTTEAPWNRGELKLSKPIVDWLTKDYPALVEKYNIKKDNKQPNVAIMKQTSPAIIPRNC